MEASQQTPEVVTSFYDHPHVQVDWIPIGQGIPLGIERVSNPEIGIGGAYGTWGEDYDNEALPRLVEDRSGEPLSGEEKLNLSELGFVHRHHLPSLSEKEYIELEIMVGARFLSEAARACGWEPSEVQGVVVGTTLPVIDDYT